MDIKDLTKEQIEEAKACKTTEERINFFKEHNISLPDSYLEKISGGEGGFHWQLFKMFRLSL